jgi:hypothetical protein
MSLPDSAGRAIAQQAFLVGALELGLDRAVDHPALTGTLSFGGFRRFFLGVRQMLQGQMLPPRQDDLAASRTVQASVSPPC